MGIILFGFDLILANLSENDFCLEMIEPNQTQTQNFNMIHIIWPRKM